MANSKRRYIDKNGSMFIPMNVEGGTWNEHFITTPKLITIGAIVFSAIFLGMWLASVYAGPSSYIIFYVAGRSFTLCQDTLYLKKGFIIKYPAGI